MSRNTVRQDPVQALREAEANLVLVFGEANAWPLDRPDRPQPDEAELLQLVAWRADGGDAFEAVLAPTRPLSPTAAFHLDLDESAFAAAEPRAQALARFRAFLSPGDALVGWGPFCRDLLEAEGEPARPFLDLRAVMAHRLQRRPGSVEAWAGRLGVALPDGQGRAARRLRSMRSVLRALLDGTLPREARSAQPPLEPA